MHTLTSYAGAVMPAADIFTTGSSVANKATLLLVGFAAVVVLFALLKQLLRAPGFVAALGAILGAVVLLWLLTNVNNNSLHKPFDDTITNVVNNGAPVRVVPLPAGEESMA